MFASGNQKSYNPECYLNHTQDTDASEETQNATWMI